VGKLRRKGETHRRTKETKSHSFLNFRERDQSENKRLGKVASGAREHWAVRFASRIKLRYSSNFLGTSKFKAIFNVSGVRVQTIESIGRPYLKTFQNYTDGELGRGT
jgi:hypothetical protein